MFGEMTYSRTSDDWSQEDFLRFGGFTVVFLNYIYADNNWGRILEIPKIAGFYVTGKVCFGLKLKLLKEWLYDFSLEFLGLKFASHMRAFLKK